MQFISWALAFLLFILTPAFSLSARAGTPNKAAKSCKNPVVFIDAGHGGLNIGAVGVGDIREKEVTLDISLRLETLLKKQGAWRPVLSRDEDKFIGLRERTRMANDAGAQVFLSIHANANPSSEPQGVEIYLLSADAANTEGMDVVIREEGHQFHEEHKTAGIGSVLYALRLAGAQRESASLAQVLLNALTLSTDAPDRGVRQASFAVLKEAEMPALVVEVGYLTNPEEAKRLAQGEYRQRIAEGLFQALADWKKRGIRACEANAPRQLSASARP